MWGFLAALISGALMSIQGVFNTEVTKQSSLWVSTGWVQLTALLVCVAAWFSFCSLRCCVAFYRAAEHFCVMAGGE